MREDGEQCDDGNLVVGDGCNAQCQIEVTGGDSSRFCEAWFLCSRGHVVLSAPVCGNGILELPGETCDDGNTIPGDGCTNCTIDGGLPTCGNGVVEAGEQCDDGNLMFLDGCSPACQLDPVCGNGIFEQGEQCDDGNLANGDGCSSICQREGCEFANIDVVFVGDDVVLPI